MVEWRDVVGYEGLYSVSNAGEIFSHITNKVLKHNVSPNGYHTVELFKRNGEKSKRVLVHRLVAMAFLQNTFNYPQVNHIDENKENNCANNLEWCTAKHNMNYGNMAKIRHTLIDYTTENRKDIARKNGKAVSKPVEQFSVDGLYIASYPSAAEAGRITGISKSHIGECCNGNRYKTVGGYIWKFGKVV